MTSSLTASMGTIRGGRLTGNQVVSLRPPLARRASVPVAVSPEPAHLIWLEDGVEKAAPENEETVCPWLEESAEWGAVAREKKEEEPEASDSSGLIWL